MSNLDIRWVRPVEAYRAVRITDENINDVRTYVENLGNWEKDNIRLVVPRNSEQKPYITWYVNDSYHTAGIGEWIVIDSNGRWESEWDSMFTHDYAEVFDIG